MPAIELLQALGTDMHSGLSESEAGRRFSVHGPNQLKAPPVRSVWMLLVNQFKSLIIGLLILASGISFLYGEIPEGWAILIVILINTLIGFFTEWKAIRSMEALYRLGVIKTRVLRQQKVTEINAEKLVPGDIVIVEGGDIISADMRLIEGSGLQADESTLTGENMPSDKTPDEVAPEMVLADRSCMLYKGTAISRGSGIAVVVQTGLRTELGQISDLVSKAESEQTPLEERLNRLGYRLIVLTLGIAFVITLAGILRGADLYLMIETGIALAVASIPEGLPVVATLTLARGLKAMAEKNALINRLSSVETLGSTGIIFTDKTGTLTENRLTVARMVAEGRAYDFTGDLSETDAQAIRLPLEVAVLCNNAVLNDDKTDRGSGDPLEVALLSAASKAGISVPVLKAEYPETGQEAFDPDTKMMATRNRMPGQGYRVSVKGAPGEVINKCVSQMDGAEPKPLPGAEKKALLEQNRMLAKQGFRVLALAYKKEAGQESEPYDGLTFLALVAFLDPPRKEVKQAIQQCKDAGIRVIMVTGDQVETARYISEILNLTEHQNSKVLHGKDLKVEGESGIGIDPEDVQVFARISPAQKLQLVRHYQEKGFTVAMTGDGVNDAPALKQADIGIAMGLRGTQVAREAADMVLTDDAFPSIVSAVEQGRIIFRNIRRFIYYLLSCNVSEVLIVGLAILFTSSLPLLPLQILFLNLVTDVFPALALGAGKGYPGIMQEAPRENGEAVLTPKEWTGIAGYGVVITAAVLISFYTGIRMLDYTETQAVTLSFLTLAFAQLWHVFNMREPDSDMIHNSVTGNKWIWAAAVLCIMLLLSALYLPALSGVMELQAPDSTGWQVIITMSLMPLAAGEIYRKIHKLRNLPFFS